MLLAETNNVVDNGPLFVSSSTVDASAAIH